MDHAPRPTAVTEAEPPIPPVVAVVVTCEPGWWLEECLSSLAEQDYPSLSVLVIDADSAEDPTPRVAAVMPSAYVRRVRRRRGFAIAANEVLGVVEGASHFVFCHDDVALAPEAVRRMVEEAYRSNAGIVAPKLVSWFHPDRLLAVGMGADGFGVPVALVEPGELDQEQHDVVRDVFFGPSACALVRADLFVTLGGFETGYGRVGEDLDLSWRARIAGARVVTAPDAAVRHVEATSTGRRALDGALRSAAPDEVPDVPHAFHSRPPERVDTSDEDSLWDTAEWTDDAADWTDDVDGAVGPGEIGAAAGVGHHASRRARRAAERGSPHDSWGGDDEDFAADLWSHRKRERHPTAPRAAAPIPPRPADADELDELRSEARLRAVATNYVAPRALLRLGALFLLTLAEAIARLVREGPRSARRTLRPWSSLTRQSRAIRKRRRVLAGQRAVPDREVIALQVGGTTRLRQALRSAVIPEGGGRRRAVAVAWVAALVFVAIGSRHLLTGHIPSIGELTPWPGLSTLSQAAVSGWRTTGLGVAGPPPTAVGILTVAGAAFLGHMTLLQHVLLLGMIPLGAAGASWTARPLGPGPARLVAAAAYLVVPLPYDALAEGRWSGLVAYAALPWILGLLLRSTGSRPFLPGRRRWRTVAALALATALAGAVQPGMIPLVLLVGAAVVLGSIVAREPAGRPLVLAALGVLGAIVLLSPWAIQWLPPGGVWATFTGVPAAGARPLHLATLLRFQTGPLGAGVLGYALLVAAVLPLLIGREWRGAWAVRLWTVALCSFGLAWAGQHGALGIVWPQADVLLAPAAAAVALSVAIGFICLSADLSGFTFGWRQVVTWVAVGAAGLACLPVLGGAFDGRWQQPLTGYDDLLSWMPAKRAEGDFRVLWLGSSDVLPLPGFRGPDGLAYATSRNGAPDLLDQWPGTSRGTTNLLDQALELARRGETTDLGHLLAPMAVRYIVVVTAPAPLDASARDARPLPADLSQGLASQLDLRAVDRSAADAVYENVAWAPMRLRLPDGASAAATLDDPRAARTADLSQAPAVPLLPDQTGPTAFLGPVPPDAAVEVAEAPSAHWTLRVAGHTTPRQPAFAVANLFTTSAGGPATLSYQTPIGWRLALAGEAGVWLLAIFVALGGARRRPEPPDETPDALGLPQPIVVGEPVG